MRKILLQYCTSEHKELMDLSQPINKSYAERLGFEYIENSVRRCPDRSIYWEKIAFFREFLPTFEDGTLVVWEDVDSLNLKDISFEGALPTGGIFGMVQNRGGLNGKQLISWYNAGVIVMINCQIVRDFLDRVWARTEDNDEAAMVAELRENGWELGDGLYISSLNPKWNNWQNNDKVCCDPIVKSWHGVSLAEKVSLMKDFISKIK